MTNDLIKRLIAFAEGDENILALTKGNDPEDDVMTRSIVYYFIAGEIKYNPERSDRISELSMKLAREGYDCILSECPNCVLSDYPFLGEVIWKREEVN